MNPSLLSFYPKFLLDEKTGIDKTPKAQVFDQTPYVANDIDPANVAGIILQARRENVLFYTGNFSTPDVTFDPAYNAKIDLPVDSNNDTLYGNYLFEYRTKIYNEVILTNQAIDPIPAATFSSVIAGNHPEWVSQIEAIVSYIGVNFKIDFLDVDGNPLSIGLATVLGASNDGYNTTIEFTEITLPYYATIAQIRFTTYYSDTVEVSYCAQTWPTPNLSVSADCLKAQVTAQDKTQYLVDDTLVSRLITLNYPVMSNGEPVALPETTTSQILIVGPNIWTGSYPTFLVSTITRSFVDTLVLQQTLKAYVPLNVQCDASLCCMRPCIDNIFNAYQTAVAAGTANLPTLTSNVITISMYVNLYEISVDCGNSSAATAYLEALQNYMNLIGCECNCGGVESTEPTIIYPLYANPLPNYVPISYLEENNITIDSNTKVPTNKAVINYSMPLDYLQIDNIDLPVNTKVPTNKAVINYVGDAALAKYPYGEDNWPLTVAATQTYNGGALQSGYIDFTPFDDFLLAGGKTTIHLTGTHYGSDTMLLASIENTVDSNIELIVINTVLTTGNAAVTIKNIGTADLAQGDTVTIKFIVL